MISQRKQLINDIKALHREKKNFFPPPTSKMTLVQLKNVYDELKYTTQQQSTKQPSQELKLDMPQTKTQQPQNPVPPPHKQELKSLPEEDIDSLHEDIDDDELEEYDDLQPENTTLRTDSQTNRKQAGLEEDEVNDIILMFNEDVNLLLNDYDINNMDEDDKDFLVEEYNNLRALLDTDIANCLDTKLLSKMNRCAVQNRQKVARYVS